MQWKAPDVTCRSTVWELLLCGNIEAPSTMVVVASVAPPSVCRMSTMDLKAPAAKHLIQGRSSHQYLWPSATWERSRACAKQLVYAQHLVPWQLLTYHNLEL